MSRKIVLFRTCVLTFSIIFLVRWMKSSSRCDSKERCDVHTIDNEELGSGYHDDSEKSLQSAGLQGLIQGDITGDDGLQDVFSFKENGKNMPDKFSLAQEMQSSRIHSDITGDNWVEDELPLNESQKNIPNILSLPHETQSAELQDKDKSDIKRETDTQNLLPLKENERKASNILHFSKEMTGKYSDHAKREQIGSQDDDVDGVINKDAGQNQLDGDDEDENDNDITIYKPTRTSNCSGNSERYILRDLLSVWDNMARKHGIVYVLFYGSLLGYHRNGDVLPWDTDVDIVVEAQSYGQIRDIAVPRNFKYIKHDKVSRIVIQTDVRFPSNNRTRVSCDGRIVSWSVDGCSFQDPIARVVRGNRHLDVFAVYPLNATFFYEPVLNHYFKVSELYPTRSCVFMDTETSCPSDIPALLTRMYGADFNVPAKICIAGEWEDRTKQEDIEHSV